MQTIGTNCLCLFLLIIFLTPRNPCAAQPGDLEPKHWANELSKKDPKANSFTDTVNSRLKKLDSISVFNYLDKLADEGKTKGDYFQARFGYLKAFQLYLLNYNVKQQLHFSSREKDKIRNLLKASIDLAYKLEDDYLIAFISLNYARIVYQLGDIGPAVMYAMNGVDLYKKLGHNIKPGDYQFLAEMLYNVREYNDCIKYAKKAVTAWRNNPKEFKPFTVSCMNTVALGYHRLHLYDSAFLFYDKALQFATKENIPVWVGIIKGNMAQMLYEEKKYDTAYAWFKNDYRTSKDSGYFDNAGNSLQWAARTDLALGHTENALTEVREALFLLKLWPDPNYLKNTYYTATLVFRKMDNFDSAFYYNNLYVAVNDSLDKVVSANSLAISKARLNDEASRYDIQRLNREKRSELMARNFIILLVILGSIIALLYVNRLRVREQHKKQLALQEKNAAEALAREQLQNITQNLIEKTALADDLRRQLEGQSASAERQELVNTVSNLTILTEEDWKKFKLLFEQLYPGFFMNLQEKVTDITAAELRMAALMRLRLSANHIASILGIASNSVHKTKQRLRQRLQLEAEKDIEEVISRI
jgi:hypothetical protein